VRPTRIRRFSRRRLLAHALWAGPLATVAHARGLEPRWVRIRRARVGEARLGLRFAQFTDVHFKGDAEALEDVILRLARLDVRFAVFTGDLIEEASQLEAALAVLRKSPVPIYGIPGNHDHWSGADLGPCREAFGATGGAWLQDESLPLAGGIQLIGRDTQGAVLEPVKGRFNLHLIHYPGWTDVLGQAGWRYDLSLAGHTHGGQVRIPFVGPLVMPHDSGGYDLGWFSTPAGPLYVNPGIGTFFMPVRFNCRPEITVFEV
jgi:uncharacterized protein